jgi:NADH:ubiquinone oxidoreductase subunit 5 (subunit L)/multisubunit Na+/H+ antiporter MnhA subunit
MPVTAALFLVGAAAISGLPPLNGFASEWLVFLASFQAVIGHGAADTPLAGLAAPALALVGGLAAACFAKVFGTVFLGQARSPAAGRGREAAPAMLVPMAALAVACFAIGLFPGAWLPPLTRAAGAWSGLPAAQLAGPAGQAAGGASQVSLVAGALLLGVGILAWWRRRRLGGPQPTAPTWGCGFARPSPRMQYTGSSFAEQLVLRFGWVFFPRTLVEPPSGVFPRRAAFGSHMPDTILDLGILPLLDSGVRITDRWRAQFGGRVQSKVLLLLLGVLGLLAWLALGGPA